MQDIILMEHVHQMCMIATIMGLDRAIRCGNESVDSVYNHRGILFYLWLRKKGVARFLAL